MGAAMTRIGKVKIVSPEGAAAGKVCSRLVLEEGRFQLGIWMSSGLERGADGVVRVVYEREPYRPALVNHRFT